MLQTAPVMLLFLPTTGPGATPDGQPLRFDFTMGYDACDLWLDVKWLIKKP